MSSKHDFLALRGGEPAHTGDWPAWPVHDEREREALLGVLESGNWWYGERVRQFEEAFAAFQDARFGITCCNGTQAIELALLAVGVGAGQEVLVPAYTFIATATAVLRVNAEPVFVDVEPDTLNMDPAAAETAITDRTAAIVPVHFAGLPADMDAIDALAERHGLRVVEDSAHGWGSKWRGKGCGALGDCGTFSFQASKNLTAGEGGIVLTDDEAHAGTVRALSNVGRGEGGHWYTDRLPCGNHRMTEVQAALLMAQLSRLEEQTTRRSRNAAILDEGLAAIEGVEPLRTDPRVTRRAYHLYIFRIDADGFGASRDDVVRALQAEGVPCHGGYPHPVYRSPLFQQDRTDPRADAFPWPYQGLTVDYSAVCCPRAERACGEVVWLKHPMLLADEGDMHDIVAAVRKVRDYADELWAPTVGSPCSPDPC